MRKLLLSLGIGLLSCISFGYCSTVNDLVSYIGDYSYSISSHSSQVIIELNSSSYGTYCMHIDNVDRGVYVSFGNSLDTLNSDLSYAIYDDWDGVYACIYSNLKYIFFYNAGNNNVNIDFTLFKLNALLNTQVPVMTALECQTNYNLVPLSSLESCQSSLNQCQSSSDRLYQDLNTCSSSLSQCQYDFEQASGYVSSLEGELSQCTNDLLNCGSSSNSGSCESGNNWSALYINDIQHLGKPNIFITIPEEINWDYTSEGDDFDLTVSGYNVDAEYIEGVINKQNYIPTTEDLTEVFSNLGSFGGLLVVCLFVILVFYMFKKIFS